MMRFMIHCPSCNTQVVEQEIKTKEDYKNKNGVILKPTEFGNILSVKVFCKDNEFGRTETYTLIDIECKKCSQKTQALIDKNDILNDDYQIT